MDFIPNRLRVEKPCLSRTWCAQANAALLFLTFVPQLGDNSEFPASLITDWRFVFLPCLFTLSFYLVFLPCLFALPIWPKHTSSVSDAAYLQPKALHDQTAGNIKQGSFRLRD
jgi:hypothetical protein